MDTKYRVVDKSSLKANLKTNQHDAERYLDVAAQSPEAAIEFAVGSLKVAKDRFITWQFCKECGKLSRMYSFCGAKCVTDFHKKKKSLLEAK